MREFKFSLHSERDAPAWGQSFAVRQWHLEIKVGMVGGLPPLAPSWGSLHELKRGEQVAQGGGGMPHHWEEREPSQASLCPSLSGSGLG